MRAEPKGEADLSARLVVSRLACRAARSAGAQGCWAGSCYAQQPSAAQLAWPALP